MKNLPQAEACLRLIDNQPELASVEVIVVSALDCAVLAANRPSLKRVSVDANVSAPAARAMGLRAASSQRAAVLSEDYRIEPSWAAAACEAASADVLVGEVHGPKRGIFARAAYLWEYSSVAAPAAPGDLDRAAACRSPAGAVIYRLDGLDLEAMSGAASEMEHHGRLFDAGRTFRRNPQLAVRYEAPRRGDFFADRRLRSYAWAQHRAAALSWPLRIAAGASRIALPFVLLGRFWMNAAVRPRYWGAALLGKPYAALFAVTEMWGEMQGYFGRRG